MGTISHLPTRKTGRPTTESWKVTRDKYLTPTQMKALLAKAKKSGRYPERDYTLLLIGYRHGLRVSELIALRWKDVDMKAGYIHIRRLKNGVDSVHPLRAAELTALKRLKKKAESPYIFTTERGTPMTADNVRKIISRIGEEANLGHLHPHMLRHSCGYKLANDGVDTRALAHYLGHKNLQNTAVYTALSPKRFDQFWLD